jgi:hypothetical protein
MRAPGKPKTLETGYAVDSGMASPESLPDGTRQRLTDLRNGLLHLHKSLLDSESARYDHDIARITSKGQLLNLVLHDPFFAWLHELSELVVQIDEILDAKEPATTADDDRLLAQARELLSPAEATGNFREQYLEALQRDPNVVMAHALAMKMLASLGATKSGRRTQQDETE